MMRKLIYMFLFMGIVSCGNGKQDNPMKLDVDKCREKIGYDNDEAGKATMLATNWRVSKSEEDSLALVEFLEDGLNEPEPSGLVCQMAFTFYMMQNEYDVALNALDKMDNEYAQMVGGDVYKDYNKLRAQSIKAYADGDGALSKSYLKECYKLISDYFDKNEGEIYEELDRQGDRIDFGVKPGIIVLQYSIMLYLEDEKSFEAFKDTIISRYPKLERWLSNFPELMEAGYQSSFIGF